MLEEEVQLRVAPGVDCNLKQRHKDILQHLLEVGQLLLCVIDVTLKRTSTNQLFKIYGSN